jgi:cell division protein FtsQ
MARRLAERSAMHRHRLRRTVWAWVAAVATVAALAWAAFFSPLFGLDPARVEISGQGSTVDVARVEQVVRAEAGVPLTRLDTVALREQLLAVDGVKDVTLARGWPDGLVVRLTAREPVAAVPDGERFALVDDEGVRVGTLDAAPEGMPVVDVPLGQDAAPALRSALHVLAGLPDDLLGQVRKVAADTRDDVRMALRSGVEVRWGDDSRMPLKVRVVQSLLGAAPDARVLDVSSPELPVTR